MEVQSMSDQQELYWQASAGLRHVARVFLNRAVVLQALAETDDRRYTRIFLQSGREANPIRRRSLLSGRIVQP